MSRQLDDRDSAVFLMYALLVREVQWFEVCLGGVLDARTTDLRTPVEERMPELERELRLTPSKVGRRLGLPDPIIKDLRELVGVRNRIVHVWLLSYQASREKEGDGAVDTGLRALEQQLFIFNRASERLVELAAAMKQADSGTISPQRATALWRGDQPVLPS